jgi:hypothetical protein
MALIQSLRISGGFTRRDTSDPIPWGEVGPAFASVDLLAAGTTGIGAWSISPGAAPGTLVTGSVEWQMPVEGRYHQSGNSPRGGRRSILSAIKTTSGDYLISLSEPPARFKILLTENSPMRLDLDRSGRGERAALWRASTPDEVLLLQQSDLLNGNIAGTTVSIGSTIAGALGSSRFDVTQVCFHEPQVGVVASLPGTPRKVALVRNVLNNKLTIVNEVHEATLALSFDSLILSAAFDPNRIGWTAHERDAFLVNQKSLNVDPTSRVLYYVGPLASKAVALIAPEPGFDHAYPSVTGNSLVFAQAWPVPNGGVRAVRKTAFLAYDLTQLPAGNGIVGEITDKGLWSDREQVVEQRPTNTGSASTVAFFERDFTPGASIPFLRAGLIQL